MILMLTLIHNKCKIIKKKILVIEQSKEKTQSLLVELQATMNDHLFYSQEMNFYKECLSKGECIKRNVYQKGCVLKGMCIKRNVY